MENFQQKWRGFRKKNLKSRVFSRAPIKKVKEKRA
jgi:hypothetical protein